MSMMLASDPYLLPSNSISGAQLPAAAAYWSFMRLRLALQPVWVRFLVSAAFFAVFWGVGNILVRGSSGESIWVTVIVSIYRPVGGTIQPLVNARRLQQLSTAFALERAPK